MFFVAAFEDTTVESSLQPASDLSAAAYNLGNQAAKPFPYYDSVEEARPFPVTLPPNTYTNRDAADDLPDRQGDSRGTGSVAVPLRVPRRLRGSREPARLLRGQPRGHLKHLSPGGPPG